MLDLIILEHNRKNVVDMRMIEKTWMIMPLTVYGKYHHITIIIKMGLPMPIKMTTIELTTVVMNASMTMLPAAVVVIIETIMIVVIVTILLIAPPAVPPPSLAATTLVAAVAAAARRATSGLIVTVPALAVPTERMTEAPAPVLTLIMILCRPVLVLSVLIKTVRTHLLKVQLLTTLT